MKCMSEQQISRVVSRYSSSVSTIHTLVFYIPSLFPSFSCYYKIKTVRLDLILQLYTGIDTRRFTMALVSWTLKTAF